MKTAEPCYFQFSKTGRLSNKIVLIFALCVFAGSALGTLTSNKTCLDRNPLIKLLKGSHVQLFEYPTNTTSNSCKSEWHHHQTCCDGVTLHTYALQDKEQIDQSYGLLEANIEALLNYTNKHRDQARNIIKEKGTKHQLRSFGCNLRRFVKILKSSSPATNSRVAEERKKCFAKIKQIRSSSLCFICSGRSDYFFLKGHAKVSMSFCKSTLRTCANTWHNTLKVVKAIFTAKKVRKILTAVDPNQKFLDFGSKDLANLEKIVRTRRLNKNIKKCYPRSKKCAEIAATTLCETFVSLVRTGLTQQVERLLKQPVVRQSSEVHHQLAFQSKWKVGGGRLLELRDHQQDDFIETGFAHLVHVQHTGPQLAIPLSKQAPEAEF